MKMEQREINEAEWKNPENWSGSFGGFYFSKKDTRTWVPKSIPWMGWTLNLGKPAGARWLVGFFAGVPIFIIVILILTMKLQR